jgi:uncharacterized membrane protein YphA (DoxX/SURF4 family)
MRKEMSKRANSTIYWVATVITALVFLTGGAAYVAGAEVQLRGMSELGYPAYFVTILGIWKVLGGLAILAPRLPRLKEWAYAGIAFDLTGAAFSHAAMSDPASKVVVPLLLLGIAVASWALRPESRKLSDTKVERAMPRATAGEIRAA